MINRELIDAHKELLASAYSQAQAYTNLVIAAGYAGFFGIWSFVKDDLSKAAVLWSALLVTVSLASFVGWEVYSMFYRSRSLLGISEAIKNPERFEELILKHQLVEQDRVVTFGRVWLTIFPFTVVTGFGALFILLFAFTRALWQVYFGA